MEIYSETNGNGAQPVNLKSPLKAKGMGCNFEGNEKAKCDSQNKCGSKESNMASFTTNNNSAVCLPLVSEGLKLVWTQSDQTSELDSIPELVQAFNLFPYPSSREVNLLAKVCVLPLDKVKVWFMVQRIKYGISWSSEEIEETRRKLSVPELYHDSPETHGKELESKGKKNNNVVDGTVEESLVVTPKKKSRCDSPDSYKPPKHTAPCFSSSLPPPQDSYYYHSPADKQESQLEPTLNISETNSQQNRLSRYRKSKSQLAALRKSFLRENWPSESELRRLQEETGLSRNDIRKWFSDSRYQLRVGRGSLAAAQGFSHNTAAGLKPDKINEFLPFVSKKHDEPNGASVDEEPESNGMKNSDFFQKFLSSSLEAFRDKTEVYDSEELSRDSEDCIKDEQEQPLQLTKQWKNETDVLQQPSNLKVSPKSPPSDSPVPTFSPVKQLSYIITTSKKSVHSSKASPSQTHLNASVASTSPSLTPAGRPRKTKEQLDALKQHFLRCQWPKGEDYTELVKLTGLPRADIIQWFGDTRYAVKNGQLRWVKGVRDQFLAELNAQQNAVNNGSSPRIGGSLKPKSAFPDIQPLVTYYHTTGLLQEKDLDSLCKKSKMSYQQVRDWFAAQDSPDQAVAMD